MPYWTDVLTEEKEMARPSSFDRDEALAKARDLFWRKGFHATSMKDLEVTLSLKPGSIYGAFGNKEALYRECLDLYMKDSQAVLEATLAAWSSPLTALAAYIRGFGGLQDKSPVPNACMVVKTLLETRRGGPKALNEVAEVHFQSMAGVFTEVFERAKTLEEVAPDFNTRRGALKLQAAVTGLRTMADNTPNREEISALAEDFATDIESLRVQHHTAL